MLDSHTKSKLIFRLTVYVALLIGLGLFLGELGVVFGVGMLLLISWHYHQLYRLYFWLWKERRLMPPQGYGAWEGIFNGLYRLQRKNRKRINQFSTLLGRFRQGAEALPDAAVVLDYNNNILWCNKLAQHMLGLVWPKDTGQRIDNLLRHPHFSTYLKENQYENALELPSPVIEHHILEIRLMPYGDRQLLLIARDITQVSQLKGMRKEFVANVSHELKTPLTVLQGYLEMMQDMEHDPASTKAVMLMQQQTSRMQAMVEQLLVLSRIEEASDINYKQHINMTQFMEVLRLEIMALANGNYDVIVEVEPELHIYGNELQLRSACSNLISNAIRYTELGGRIIVKWEKLAVGARFSVTDTGDGIALQHIHRLTERFYRVDNARSRETGGSGLGLAIVKHALNEHHCQLDIVSEEGKGSTFSFTLPPSLLV